MKKQLSLMALMFIICSFGAKVASAEQVVLDPAKVVQVGNYGLAFGKVVKAAELQVTVAKFNLSSCRPCSQWDTDRLFGDVDKAQRNFDAVKASVRSINGRLVALKRSSVAERRDLDKLRIDVAKLQGMEAEDANQIEALLTKMVSVEIVQQQQAAEVYGLKQELPKVKKTAEVAQAMAGQALQDSILMETEVMGGVGKSFTTTEALFGGGVTWLNRATGNGWQSNILFGINMDADKPHLTSIVLRGGHSWAVGGNDSSLIANVGGLVGMAAEKDLNDTQELQGGIGGGATLLDAVGPVSVGVRAEYTWGINHGALVNLVFGVSPSRIKTHKRF